jgi:hypothetical protein
VALFVFTFLTRSMKHSSKHWLTIAGLLSTTPSLVRAVVSSDIPYQIPQGQDWCNDLGKNIIIHQNVPGCGRVCSYIDPETGVISRGLYSTRSWSPEIPCSACPAAEWPGCPKFVDPSSSPPTPPTYSNVETTTTAQHATMPPTLATATHPAPPISTPATTPTPPPTIEPTDPSSVVSDASTILRFLGKSSTTVRSSTAAATSGGNAGVNKATHTFDAYVPILWTHREKDREEANAAALAVEEQEKQHHIEQAEIMETQNKNQMKLMAASAKAEDANNKKAEARAHGDEGKEEKKKIVQSDLKTAEVVYVVDVPKASHARFKSKKTELTHKNKKPTSKKESLRWDIRKTQTEAKRHEWQRSPYVCPLSTMQMTKYPDEFGTHQGTMESPDAYRRAMAETISAAEHVATSCGGNPKELPTMAYAPDVRATLRLEDPQSVMYQPIMSHFFSDIDGRSKYAVMGSPGGDIGEFLLAMVAFESASMTTSRADTGLVYQMMSQFLEDMGKYGKLRFAMVTDEAAVASWTRSAEVTDALHPMTPDGKGRAIATSSLPGSIGSEHLRLMMEHPDEYEGVRPGLLKSIIESFFTIYYDSTHPSQPSLMLIVQKGKHEEKGLVVVDRTGLYPEACKALTPLIVPDTGHQSYYVYHRAAAEEHRSGMAEWLMQSQGWSAAGTHPSMGNRLFEDMRRMASKWFENTKDHIMKGVPRYRVAFGTDHEK